MALTPQIQAPQAGVMAVIREIAPQIRSPFAGAFVVYNIPTEEIRVTAAGVVYAFRQLAELRVPQASVMAVVAGRVETPKLRAWAFTLDGHDFYVLKLGTTGKTLVYDLSTKEWSWWSYGNSVSWRALIGLNWTRAGGIPNAFGSSVIVGDDSYGILWVLDPDRGTDDSLLVSGEQRTFPRVATAQLLARGRGFRPVFNISLSGSVGVPALTANLVTLDYSDDQGRSYRTAEDPQISVAGNRKQQIEWRSLGRLVSPGRIMRISDNGSFARVDVLNVNTGMDEEK